MGLQIFYNASGARVTRSQQLTATYHIVSRWCCVSGSHFLQRTRQRHQRTRRRRPQQNVVGQIIRTKSSNRTFQIFAGNIFGRDAQVCGGLPANVRGVARES